MTDSILQLLANEKIQYSGVEPFIVISDRGLSDKKIRRSDNKDYILRQNELVDSVKKGGDPDKYLSKKYHVLHAKNIQIAAEIINEETLLYKRSPAWMAKSENGYILLYLWLD